MSSELTLECVYAQYKKDVYRYLMYLCHDHYLAEDLVQETFCKAWIYMDQLTDSKVKPWLIRVSYNAYVDRLRKDSRLIAYEDEFFHQFQHEDTPENQAMLNEKFGELNTYLNVLNTCQKEAVILYDLKGYSYKEAADMMNISLSKFKITLYRARQRLRQLQMGSQKKTHVMLLQAATA